MRQNMATCFTRGIIVFLEMLGHGMNGRKQPAKWQERTQAGTQEPGKTYLPIGCFSSWKITMSCGLLRFSARMEISKPVSRFALKMASFSRSVQNTLSCGIQM